VYIYVYRCKSSANTTFFLLSHPSADRHSHSFVCVCVRIDFIVVTIKSHRYCCCSVIHHFRRLVFVVTIEMFVSETYSRSSQPTAIEPFRKKPSDIELQYAQPRRRATCDRTIDYDDADNERYVARAYSIPTSSQRLSLSNIGQTPSMNNPVIMSGNRLPTCSFDPIVDSASAVSGDAK
jgi:hypothetical protein